MKEKFKQVVYAALADIFGTMFFTPIEPVDEMPPKDQWLEGASYIEARIEVTRKETATIILYFPYELARKVCANFMGVDKALLEEKQVVDTVKEAANMTVGGVLGVIDPCATCTLGIPSSRLVTDFSPEVLAGKACAAVYETEFGYMWMDCGTIEMCDSR
mgnify:CR=1 FL=1